MTGSDRGPSGTSAEALQLDLAQARSIPPRGSRQEANALTKDTNMTKANTTQSAQPRTARKKLQLNKETLRDLQLAKTAGGPHGGRARGDTFADTCTMNRTKCDEGDCD